MQTTSYELDNQLAYLVSTKEEVAQTTSDRRLCLNNSQDLFSLQKNVFRTKGLLT